MIQIAPAGRCRYYNVWLQKKKIYFFIIDEDWK